MAEFGQPQRTATEDANAGIVNPPSVKTVARDTVSRSTSQESRRKASLDAGVANMGQTLGNSLVQFLDKTKVNINEQRELAAANKQGRDTAVHEEALMDKRTGWKEALFGQSAEYRGAQQQAVINSVNSLYLEQAARVDEYAGERPEDYEVRLQRGLDTALEPHANDPETRALITKAYKDNSQKLVEQQYLAHIGAVQTESKINFEAGVMIDFDMMSQESTVQHTPEQKAEFLERTRGYFNVENRPKGQTVDAYRTSLNGMINQSLKSGNIGPAKAAEASGWKLSAAEQVQRDSAWDGYDVAFAQEAQRVHREIQLAATTAATPEDAVAVYDAGVERLDALEAKSSGSDKATSALLGYEVSLEAKKRAIFETARKSAEKVAEAEAEMAADDASVAAEMQGNPTDAGAIPVKRQQEASDRLLSRALSDHLGGAETLSTVEVIGAVLEDPSLARVVRQVRGESQVKSRLISGIVKAGMQGVQTKVDPETGRPTLEAMTGFVAITQFADTEQFVKDLGETDYTRFKVVQTAMERGATVDMIGRDLDNYMHNKGNFDLQGFKAPKIQRDKKWYAQSMNEYVGGLVKSLGKFNPSPSQQARYTEQYKMGLVIHGGDKDGASDYLASILHSQAVKYHGVSIPNSDHLETIQYDDGEFNFQTVFDGMQSLNLFGPYITTMYGKEADGGETPIRTLEGVNYKLTTRAGFDGVWLSAPDAQQAVHVPMAALERSANILNERNKDIKVANAAFAASERGRQSAILTSGAGL
tara:strand:- start:2737 stop:5019 length:2283 start_codon:yes stop_codon:yes gene_type:complete